MSEVECVAWVESISDATHKPTGSHGTKYSIRESARDGEYKRTGNRELLVEIFFPESSDPKWLHGSLIKVTFQKQEQEQENTEK